MLSWDEMAGPMAWNDVGSFIFLPIFQQGFPQRLLLAMPLDRYSIRKTVADILTFKRKETIFLSIHIFCGRALSTPWAFAHYISRLSVTMTKYQDSHKEKWLLAASKVSDHACLALWLWVCGRDVHCGGHCVVEEPIHPMGARKQREERVRILLVPPRGCIQRPDFLPLGRNYWSLKNAPDWRSKL